MRTAWATALVTTVLATVWTAAQPLPLTPEAIAEDLLAEDSGKRAVAEAAAIKVGAPMVRALCDLMDQESTKAVTVAEKTLFAIAATVSVPEQTAKRDAFVRVLAGELARDRPPHTRNEIVRLLGLFGTKESAEVLYGALTDPDTADAALSALLRHPRNDIVRRLGMLLSQQEARGGGENLLFPPEKTDALLRALGALRNFAATPFLVAYLRLPNARKAAALEALGMIGDPQAAVTLAQAVSDPDETVRSSAVGALIALADAEEQRAGSLARRCYRRAYDYAVTPAQRAAALLGLADTDASMRAVWLLKGMSDDFARPLVEAELQELERAELYNPLIERCRNAQGEELQALRALAEAKGIRIPE